MFHHQLTNHYYPTNDQFVLCTAHRSTRTDMLASAISRSSRRQSRSSRATLEQSLFLLIRLEAHSHAEKTVCVTLPGQAVTAPVLPILQQLFPCEDRHVFVFDGCANVVSRCLIERTLPEVEFRRSVPSAIRHTTPPDRSLTKQISALADALRDLPRQYVDSTELLMLCSN